MGQGLPWEKDPLVQIGAGGNWTEGLETALEQQVVGGAVVGRSRVRTLGEDKPECDQM